MDTEFKAFIKRKIKDTALCCRVCSKREDVSAQLFYAQLLAYLVVWRAIIRYEKTR